jgi:arsenate reductase
MEPTTQHPFPYQGILFLCRGNAVRSQMAEALLKKFAPAGVHIWSAGEAPVGLDPRSVTVMNEIGIDISGQRSKHFSEIPLDQVDLVITLCDDNTVCPRVPGKHTIMAWPLPDAPLQPPSGSDGLDPFRDVRDQLTRRIQDFVVDVGENSAPQAS